MWNWLEPSSGEGITPARPQFSRALRGRASRSLDAFTQARALLNQAMRGRKHIWQRNERVWWVVSYYRLDINWDVVAFTVFEQTVEESVLLSVWGCAGANSVLLLV